MRHGSADSRDLVLLIDPRPDRGTAVCRRLEADGFTAVAVPAEAATGIEAGLELPDVIVRVADEPLTACPVLWGALSRSPHGRDIPVVLVAPTLPAAARRQVLASWAVEVLEAPVDLDHLVERVGVYARLRRAHRRVLTDHAVRVDALRDAQQALLPRAQHLPEARFGVAYFPIHEAGGDFYDVIPLGRGSFGYLVADVSGHDLGASYTTAALKALLAAAIRRDPGPDRVMAELNAGLKPLLPGGRYLTACLANLDREGGRLSVACAGHPSPILVPGRGAPRYLETRGDVLGAFAEIEVAALDVAVAAGDRVLLFSDGVLHAAPEGRALRPDPLEVLLDQAGRTRDLPIELAVAEMVIQLLSPGDQPLDDLVLLGVDV